MAKPYGYGSVSIEAMLTILDTNGMEEKDDNEHLRTKEYIEKFIKYRKEKVAQKEIDTMEKELLAMADPCFVSTVPRAYPQLSMHGPNDFVAYQKKNGNT